MKILIAQPIPKVGVELLKKHFSVEEADHMLSKEEMINAISDKDALVCAMHNVDAEIINAGKNLKVISQLGSGFNNIDIKLAGEKGIKVTNAPGVMMQTVAEFAFAHMLALTRKVAESDRYIRSGKFRTWDFSLMVGNELKGKILGVIGFGAIAKHLVPIAKGFGMEMLYNNQQGEVEDYKHDSSVQFSSKENLLQNSDFVLLLVPLNETTRHLMKYEQFCMMKPTAFFVNLARGKVVKEQDLIRALKEKKIAGAGLDVYEFEPEISKELLLFSNTVLTPHVGGATEESRANLSLIVAQNVISVLSGETCNNIVNTEFLEKVHNEHI